LPIIAGQYTIGYVTVRTAFRPISAVSQRTALLLLVAVALLCVPNRVSAEATFNRNTVLDDRELDTTLAPGSSLSASAIAQFLASTGGALGKFTFDDRGVASTVPEIIARASAESHISAQYLLDLLEKEQGLITDPDPSQNQLDYATGFGCPSSCDPAYKGFAIQVRKAAERTRQYLDDLAARNRTVSGWGVGVTKVTVDGLVVIPTNRATAAIYTYNPLVGAYGGGDPRYGAISLLWKLWQRWFVAHYPDGTLLRQTGTVGIWLLENGQRRPFVSRSAFLSGYDPVKVIDVPASVLALYPIGRPIRFPGIGLVRIETGGVYLLDAGTKRPIPSREVFRTLGFNPEEVIVTTSANLADIPRGEPVSATEQFPTGQLFQIRETGGIVQVKNGIRYPIVDRAIKQSRFGGARPSPIALADLLRYTAGAPILLKDGEIVRSISEPAIFVISNGEKRPILDAETFTRLGYRWKNVLRISSAALALHPTGDPVQSVTP
jgi:hypothetical protein